MIFWILEKERRAKSKRTLRSSSKKKHKLKIAKKKMFVPKYANKFKLLILFQIRLDIFENRTVGYILISRLSAELIDKLQVIKAIYKGSYLNLNWLLTKVIDIEDSVKNEGRNSESVQNISDYFIAKFNGLLHDLHHAQDIKQYFEFSG